MNRIENTIPIVIVQQYLDRCMGIRSFSQSLHSNSYTSWNINRKYCCWEQSREIRIGNTFSAFYNHPSLSKQFLYCYRGVPTSPLHRNGSSSVVASAFVAAGMCLPSRCLAMIVCSGSTIPTLRRHVTIGVACDGGNVAIPPWFRSQGPVWKSGTHHFADGRRGGRYGARPVFWTNLAGARQQVS
jgi:hypothetical protein